MRRQEWPQHSKWNTIYTRGLLRRRVADSSSSLLQQVVEKSSRGSRSGFDVLTSTNESELGVNKIAGKDLNGCNTGSYSGDEASYDINYSFNSSTDWFTGFEENQVMIKPVVDPVHLSGNVNGPRTKLEMLFLNYLMSNHTHLRDDDYA